MFAFPEYYMEFRYAVDQALQRSKKKIMAAGKEFSSQLGRDYSALVEGYRLDDAETVLVAMGSLCGTVKDSIDEMRGAGRKVGLLKIRAYRPFPDEEVLAALREAGRVAVLDKNVSLGSKGAVGLEVKDTLYGTGIPVHDYIVGLGGRDLRKRDIARIVDLAEKGEGDLFYGLREGVA
jgi:pyruvate ferredoxin oxidoreductase alpha subunit